MRTGRGAWHWGRPRRAARWEGETGPCGEKTRLLGKTRGFRGQQTLGTKVRARTGLCRGERSSCVLRPHDGPGTRDLGRRPSQSAFGEPVCPRGRWDTAWRAAAPFSPWAVSPRLCPGSGLLHLLRTRRPLALLPSGCPRGRAPLPPRRPAAEAACAREPHPGRCDLPPHGASHGDASARRWALSWGPAGRLRA